MEHEVPMSDDLEKIGFEFSDVCEMYKNITPHGPQVVVCLHDNSRRDDYLTAKSMSLYWKEYQGKVSMQFGICDDPTLAQVKALIDCLSGEFKLVTEFRQLTEAYDRAKGVMVYFSNWFPVVRGDYLIVKYKGKTYGWTCPYYGEVSGFQPNAHGISIWGIPAKEV